MNEKMMRHSRAMMAIALARKDTSVHLGSKRHLRPHHCPACGNYALLPEIRDVRWLCSCGREDGTINAMRLAGQLVIVSWKPRAE